MLTFFFSLSFSGSPSKENACRLLTKENIILNAIKNVGNEFKDNWKRYKGGNK